MAVPVGFVLDASRSVLGISGFARMGVDVVGISKIFGLFVSGAHECAVSCIEERLLTTLKLLIAAI